MQDREPIKIRTNIAMVPIQERIKTMNQMFNFVSSWKEYREQKEGISRHKDLKEYFYKNIGNNNKKRCTILLRKRYMASGNVKHSIKKRYKTT